MSGWEFWTDKETHEQPVESPVKGVATWTKNTYTFHARCGKCKHEIEIYLARKYTYCPYCGHKNKEEGQ